MDYREYFNYLKDDSNRCKNCLGDNFIYNETSCGKVCRNCGVVAEKENFHNDDVKVVTMKNGTVKTFLLDQTNNDLFLPQLSNQANIQEQIRKCNEFIKLNNYENEQIEQQVQNFLQSDPDLKKKKIRIKQIVACSFYIISNANGRYVPLDNFLKDIDLKAKSFHKYLQLINKYTSFTFKSLSKEDQHIDIIDMFSRNLCKYNYIQQQKEELPFCKKNLEQQQNNIQSEEFDEEKLIFTISHKLQKLSNRILSNPEVMFHKNGKSPLLYVSAILIIICEYNLCMQIDLKEFSQIMNMHNQSIQNSIKYIKTLLVNLSQKQSEKDLTLKQLLKKYNDQNLDDYRKQKYNNKLFSYIIKNISKWDQIQ